MAPTQDESPSPPLEQTLKASPQLSRTDVEYLREWLSKQPHLPDMTETELVPFLHSNAYSLEKTKVCIDKYFTMRTHAPEFFSNFDINSEECQHQLGIHYYVALPKKDPNGYRIICSTFYEKDSTHFSFDEMTKLIYAYLDILIREDPTCPGYVLVMDSSKATLSHLAKVNISSISKTTAYFQEALPLKLKAIHVINVTAVGEAAYALVKPFHNEEIQKMINFHSGKMEKLYEAVPRDYLPTEFGGTLGPLKDFHMVMVDKLKARNGWVADLCQKKVDESKRPGHAISSGDVFGMEGSFKKLDID